MKTSAALFALFSLATAMPYHGRGSVLRRDLQQSPNPAKRSTLSGQATTYGGNLNGGMCSFTTMTSLPSGVYGTALSDSNWDDAALCGACLSVTGPTGAKITAMVVDQCPGCGTNHLDLFQDGFLELGTLTEGIIDVSWEVVDCPITSALNIHNKEGTSQYWFSQQVINAKRPVAKFEVSTDGSSWTSLTRTEYNFFENSSGFGTSTVDVRVTDDEGDVVTVSNVGVTSGSSVEASENF